MKRSISSSAFMDRLADLLDGMDEDTLAEFVAYLRRESRRLKAKKFTRRKGKNARG